jgi:hypothetical protein
MRTKVSNNAFTDHDRLCYLCRQEQRKATCNESIRHRKHRYSCALPEGHDGPHAYVKIRVQRFDEGGLKGYLEVESRLTTEDFDRHFGEPAHD